MSLCALPHHEIYLYEKLATRTHLAQHEINSPAIWVPVAQWHTRDLIRPHQFNIPFDIPPLITSPRMWSGTICGQVSYVR